MSSNALAVNSSFSVSFIDLLNLFLLTHQTVCKASDVLDIWFPSWGKTGGSHFTDAKTSWWYQNGINIGMFWWTQLWIFIFTCFACAFVLYKILFLFLFFIFYFFIKIMNSPALIEISGFCGLPKILVRMLSVGLVLINYNILVMVFSCSLKMALVYGPSAFLFYQSP